MKFDIDLIVIANSELEFKKRQFHFFDELKSNECVEMFVYTPEEFERLYETRSFIRQAVNGGKVIYDGSI